MKLNAYSIHDVKALTYRAPFFALNHAVAIRTLSDAVNDPSTVLHNHPADFRMYCVGVFDDATGVFLSMSPHEHVRDAVSLVKLDAQLPLDLRPNGLAADQTKKPEAN